ncbi:RNA polymerase sigma factor [Streptomyces sp. NBC_01190]|uniref:RNA polymerase sigma factor n=1 Tax=Streptomyces sp. NBC_01190 TaxID=2903767 RepID=UPI0038670492|nr:sigma-70 family RNA polymerase sigma factor [Streptomyces sp. NBC_01190]
MSVSPMNAVVQRALEGDPLAWADLMDSFSGLIAKITYNYRLSHADCADVRQFVWMKMYEHLSAVRNPEQLGGWVAVVARNECNRLVRRSSREVTSADCELATALADTEDASGPVMRAESSALLWRAVKRVLKERDYTLIHMTMADPPASYAQVSQHLGIPLGSIGPTRQRCLAQLRARLSQGECRELVAH